MFWIVLRWMVLYFSNKFSYINGWSRLWLWHLWFLFPHAFCQSCQYYVLSDWGAPFPRSWMMSLPGFPPPMHKHTPCLKTWLQVRWLAMHHAALDVPVCVLLITNVLEPYMWSEIHGIMDLLMWCIMHTWCDALCMHDLWCIHFCILNLTHNIVKRDSVTLIRIVSSFAVT